MKALQILKDNCFTPISDLNFAFDNGIEYYIGYKGKTAGVAAIIHDEDINFITKTELREMSENAKIKGIDKVYLFTNYGIELSSKYEKPSCIGFDKITKICIEDFDTLYHYEKLDNL